MRLSELLTEEERRLRRIWQDENAQFYLVRYYKRIVETGDAIEHLKQQYLRDVEHITGRSDR